MLFTDPVVAIVDVVAFVAIVDAVAVVGVAVAVVAIVDVVGVAVDASVDGVTVAVVGTDSPILIISSVFGVVMFFVPVLL